MFAILEALLGALLSAFQPRASLIAENLVLRQQLATLRRATPRPRLRPIDRAFWILMSRIWSRWADALAIVRPETVIAWHRRGFARFWTWKSRRLGRPPIAAEIVLLIERMARENPLWSRRRIANELAKLGHRVAKDTVAKYMPKPSKRPRRPPSQTWKTFLRNHHCDSCGCDLLVALSCKGRGMCPSCGTRRMCNVAAHLTDRILPDVPIRQWVLSLPFELRRLAAFNPAALTALGRSFVDVVIRSQK
jgi:hypothetical protein